MQALGSNKGLRRLDLRYNPGISDEGAKALCDVLQYNNTLQVGAQSGIMYCTGTGCVQTGCSTVMLSVVSFAITCRVTLAIESQCGGNHRHESVFLQIAKTHSSLHRCI